jgi:signal transduction histidine kinase
MCQHPSRRPPAAAPGRDAACQRRLDEARGRLQGVLDQQRQFVRDASHELRTPIAGLRLRLEEAQLHPAETDLYDLLEHALDDVSRLQEITTGLLLLARPDTGTSAPGTRRTLDLAELVRAQLSTRTDPRTVRPRLEPDVMVDAVPVQLTRLLTHLLDNAQRHARHTVRVEVGRSGDDARLSVTDDGDGIAEADRERIFQPFTRLDHARSRDHGGAGLGLAIACHIATEHHGTLTVDDPPTGGARFTLRLPTAHAGLSPLRDRGIPDLH